MRCSSNSWNQMEFVPLKGDDWLQKQLHAGKVVAECLATSKERIEEDSDFSLKDLESMCADIISSNDCTPTFKNYKGFPGAICTSVNKHMVHGIPTDYKVKLGDIVTVDLGATYQGAIADAAITAVCGKETTPQIESMITLCKNALDNAIKSIEIGKQLGCIGSAIYNTVKSSEFKLITDYGGHGICWDKPHSSPFVTNKAYSHEGIRIQPGLAIAIEPMLAIGSNKTRTLNDGWTVVTQDISVHWEHSVFVGEDKVHIITDWESFNENRV